VDAVVTLSVAVPVPPAARLTRTLVNPVLVELFKSGTGPLARTGETEAETLTSPANRPPAIRVTREVPKEPACTVSDDG